MTRHPRRLVACLSLVAVMAGSGSLAGPVTAHAREFDPMPWLGLAGQLAGPIFPSSISNGSDNRLVVLFVGSDWRPALAGTGERFDSIMVATIDSAKRISVVSIPRDIKNFPIGPGQVFRPGIYGLFKALKQASGGDRYIALANFKNAVAYGLATPIDYVVYTRFTGVERLVHEVGGVPVAVAKTIQDGRLPDDRYPALGDGAKFMQSASTLELGADAPACYTIGSPINWAASPNCTRALEYVRSRHGPGNNDWVRSRRQQGFIFAAIQRVVSRGSGANLESLRLAASNSADFYTTLPTGPADALAMYNLLSGATLVNQAVFKPYTYAGNVPGTQKQQLKIDVVRALMSSWFGPLP